MSGFNKIVPEIVQSSIWNEPSDIRIVWITLIAVKDENGYVQGDARTISRLANVSLDQTEIALTMFQQPDANSNTPDNDGRRIEKHGGGWIILNHHLYRTGDRNEYMREYMKKRRKSKNVNSVNVNITQRSVSASASDSVSDTRIEGDARGNTITPEIIPHGEAFAATWAKWCAYRKERKKQMTAMTRTAQLTALAALSETEAIETIEESIKNGWTGLFPARIKHEQTKRGTDKHRRPDGTRAGEFPHEGRKANEF